MSSCTAGQLPYRVIGEGRTFDGSTPAQACGGIVDWLNGNGYSPASVVGASAMACSVTYSGGNPYSYSIVPLCESSAEDGGPGAQAISCGSACTVTLKTQIQPAPMTTSETADYGLMFGLALGVLVVVWAAKQTIRLFKANYES